VERRGLAALAQDLVDLACVCDAARLRVVAAAAAQEAERGGYLHEELSKNLACCGPFYALAKSDQMARY
jgi:hypothetical protein